MKTIFKYPLSPMDVEVQLVELPTHFHIVHIGVDPVDSNKIAIWAGINTDNRTYTARFQIIPTGAEVPQGSAYRGSVLWNRYMLHLFELD